MDKPTKKLFRCAVYTRKSTEHNLDLEFNSLDAQREACEAYIKSQAHEGWRLVTDYYNDGAFSGASLDRPALQKLLADIGNGKIDIVVVYKVDRLTRSLADFAKLVELFDQHGVSFVSVTQSFNTTSSMGRLTLNVLLSFAQFEREVIGERVRDKIAASKRKGIWVGGPVPFGYASVNKKLVVVPDEAATVRQIFERYLELGSIGALVQDLDRRGIRTKCRKMSNDRTRGGIRYGVGHVAYLLRNRVYVGDIAYRGGIHRGEHEPIVEQGIFDAVQAKLAAGSATRQLRLRASPAILAGRIFDDRGNRMTPTHTNKQGARYRYYVSHAVLQQRQVEASGVTRVPAPVIEAVVLKALRDHLEGGADGAHPTPTDARDLIERHVERIVITPNAIELNLVGEGEGAKEEQQQADVGNPSRPKLLLPWSGNTFTAVKGIVHEPSQRTPMTIEARDALLTVIAKARGWIDALVEGRVDSFAAIAKREAKIERHIRSLVRLAFVSPPIISAIIERSAPADMTVTDLAKTLSYSWNEQSRQLGLPETQQMLVR
jgi:site-specific DNA recombinase